MLSSIFSHKTFNKLKIHLDIFEQALILTLLRFKNRFQETLLAFVFYFAIHSPDQCQS